MTAQPSLLTMWSFRFDRIRQPQGTMGIYVSGVKEMKKVDDHTLEVILDKPNPTLLNNFTTFYIMSKIMVDQEQV
jgi:peptide/nickel transport system substrate-binding protein